MGFGRTRAADLGTGIGTGKQDARARTSQSGSGARVAKVSKGRDDLGDGLLLTEAGLGTGQQDGNESGFGEHDDDDNE